MIATNYITPQVISINDAILKAIESNYNTSVKKIHDEARGYCFKNKKNKWQVAPFDLINRLAGLENVNYCLLNY